MDSNDVIYQIQQLFNDSCCELLSSLNCEIERLDDDIDLGDAPIACIDAGSNQLELNVGIQMPSTVLSLTYPVPNVIDIDDESLEDWLSELSNQLIGRLKAKLYRHNLEITLGLPASYFGISIDHLISAEHERMTFTYDVDGQECAFYLGIELFSQDIVLSEQPEESADVLFESEIELF